MLVGEPLPLGEDAEIITFRPDSTCSWLVVYAGPCVDPECSEEDHQEDRHDQLFFVPMIGWYEVLSDLGFQLRPVVMTSTGVVSDYLDMPTRFRFVAVLADSTTTLTKARAIYALRFGKEIPHTDAPLEPTSLPN